jgi:hypothetical protein
MSVQYALLNVILDMFYLILGQKDTICTFPHVGHNYNLCLPLGDDEEFYIALDESWFQALKYLWSFKLQPILTIPYQAFMIAYSSHRENMLIPSCSGSSAIGGFGT